MFWKHEIYELKLTKFSEYAYWKKYAAPCIYCVNFGKFGFIINIVNVLGMYELYFNVELVYRVNKNG